MSAKTLQEKLWSDMRISVTEEQAQEYLNKFFTTYPGVADYIEDTKAFVEAYKFTFTFTGRRRRFPYASFSRSQLGRVQRQAVNARIQTTSSDMVAMNLLNVHNAIKPLGGRVLITVHDSIGFQLPKGTTGVRALLDKAIIEATARDCPWLPVVWKYDAAKGPNYGDVHEQIT